MELAREDRPQNPRSDTFKSLFLLTLHIATGSIAFIVLALPAILINIASVYSSKIGATYVITIGLRISVYAILTTDLVLFLVFLVRTLYRFILEY
jgi:hypothetical protein